MVTNIKSYKQLQSYLTDTATELGLMERLADAPHGVFWNDLNYTQFTTGKLPGVGIRIVIPGDVAASALINILKAEYKGMPRMAPDGPYFSDDQIASVATWIAANCPEFAPPADVTAA